MTDNTTNSLEQRISVPITVGDRITLFEDVDMDEEGGFIASDLFEGTVERYNPSTGLLEFEENDVGRAEFLSLLDEAEGLQIV